MVVDEDDKGLGEETLSKEASGKEASGKDVLGSVSGCLGCIGQVLLVFFTYFLGNQGPRLDPSHWPCPMKAAMLWFNPSSASMTLETPDGVGVTVSGDRMGPIGWGRQEWASQQFGLTTGRAARTATPCRAASRSPIPASMPGSAEAPGRTARYRGTPASARTAGERDRLAPLLRQGQNRLRRKIRRRSLSQPAEKCKEIDVCSTSKHTGKSKRKAHIYWDFAFGSVEQAIRASHLERAKAAPLPTPQGRAVERQRE